MTTSTPLTHDILQCGLAYQGREIVLSPGGGGGAGGKNQGETLNYPSMSLIPYALTRPFLFGLDAETAHELTMDMLARGQRTPLQLAWCNETVDDPVELAGLTFPHRVGMAAGLDKNARCIDALGALGFGFVEVGTVTPKAQPGNPKPRMFRL